MKNNYYFSIITGILLCLTSCFFNKSEHQKERTSNLGTIVILNGTSSSGKSTVIHDLKKMYGDSYIFVNMDDFYDTYIIKHPVPASQLLIKIWVRQFFSTMLLHVKNLSREGKNVFVDLVEFDKDYNYYCSLLDNEHMVKILIYCPLDILVDRVEKRNKSGDPKEKRFLNQAFVQFIDTYKVQELSDEIIVDRITTNRLKSALQLAQAEGFQLIKESNAKEEDLSNMMKEFNIFVQQFITQFKLDTLKEIVLVPKHPWDLIINSSIYSSQESAYIIATYLKNRCN